MKPTQTLFELIQSMSSLESELFVKNAVLQQGDKNYLKLYEFLHNEKEYDEAKVKEHFKQETFVKHVASEKNQLQKHILRSLRENKIKTTNSAYADERIKNIKILAQKGLIDMAHSEAKKLRELVVREELFYPWLDLIETEIVLINTSYNDLYQRIKRLDELLEEKDICLKKILMLTRYQELLSQVQFYFDRNILIHDKSKKHILDNFLNNELLLNPENANSTKALLLATYCRIVCYRLTRNNERLGQEINKALELFLYKGFLLDEYPKLYIHLYGFYARYSAITFNLSKAREAIDHLRNIRSHTRFQTQDLQNTIFTRLSIYDLMFYNYSGSYQKSLEIVPEIENIIQQNSNKLPGQELTTINFLIFVAYFATGQYSKSLKYINEIVNSDFEKSRQDLFRMAKICNLIIHYELGNIDLLSYTYKSVKRFFSKIDYPFEYEIAFMKFFRQLVFSKRGKENSLELYVEFKNRLSEIFKDPYQVIASEYFDMIAWLDAHINSTGYAQEVLKQRSGAA